MKIAKSLRCGRQLWWGKATVQPFRLKVDGHVSPTQKTLSSSKIEESRDRGETCLIWYFGLFIDYLPQVPVFQWPDSLLQFRQINSLKPLNLQASFPKQGPANFVAIIHSPLTTV